MCRLLGVWLLRLEARELDGGFWRTAIGGDERSCSPISKIDEPICNTRRRVVSLDEVSLSAMSHCELCARTGSLTFNDGLLR
jgi:hypothetical protein